MADIKLRTKEELLLTDYNYYIFFKISPTEKDVAKIEKAILMERNKWTQGLPIQRRYKELYADVENVMIKDLSFDSSTGTYSKTGARAAELLAAKNLKLKSAVDLIVSMCQNKGRLYKSELLQITSSEKIQWFTISELEDAVSYLFKQGIKYIDDTQSVIDFRKYKEVERYLITVKKSSLYDVLGCDNGSTIAQLADAVTKVYANLKNKTTPEGTATDKLLGIAKIIFKTEESKTKYDNYLAIKESVWDQLELRQSHGIKEISMDEFLSYAETIKAALKMNIDQVELHLAAGLKEFKIIVVGSEETETKDENGDVIDLEICPYPECGKAYRVYHGKAQKSCPHCGKPLEIVCWNCGGKMPYTSKNKTCPSCHSTIQSKALFESRMADVDKILRQPVASVIDLQSSLANLINAVPNYKSSPNGYAAKKIGEYERVIADKIKEEETTGENYRRDVKKIQALINSRFYLQAHNAALNLRKNYGTYNAASTNGLISDIEKVLSQAQSHVQNAKTYVAQNNESMVISYAAKALDICADYNEARLLLQKYPPKAPKAIRQTISDGNVVRIDWDKSESQNMTTYTVVKKVGSKPTSPSDGTVLDSNLTINFYEDQNVVSATPYYYGVFAERCGVQSGVVVTSVPAIVFLDVTGVQQELVEGKISVKWDCPHNVKSIEVWKKEGPIAPTGIGDGVQLNTDGLKGFVDTQCAYENSYLIICTYEANGIKKYSRGVRRTLKQYEALQKIENPKIEQLVTGEFILTHEGSTNQKIKMICSKERISCRFDTVMQMMNFNSICKNCVSISHRYDAEQNIEFSLPEGQIYWVYPMVYNEQLFMLSKPFLLNNITGIRNITYTEEQGTVLIKGVLHNDTKNIIVKISNNEFPKTADGPEEKFVVSKERFISDGGISIKLKTNTINYISLFVELEKDGTKTITKASRVGDQPIDYREKVVVYHALSYKISTKGSFAVTVEFSSNVPVELPKLCLVKGHPRPMTKGSGELVDTIEPIKLEKGWFSKKYTGKAKIMTTGCPLNTKFVVFMYDESVKYVQLKEVKSI